MKAELRPNTIGNCRNLHVNRAGKIQPMGCPFNDDVQCGDWCPLLVENDYEHVIRLNCGGTQTELETQ